MMREFAIEDAHSYAQAMERVSRHLKHKKRSHTNQDEDRDGQAKSVPIEIKQKNYDADALPSPEKGTRHALMIDAGSQGTRIHVYEFERRILSTAEELTEALNGYKISIPTTNTRWTNRLKPGLDRLVDIPGSEEGSQLLQEALVAYLGPLLDFSKAVLEDKKADWGQFPIFLKATGGLRTLPTNDRVRLINAVRTLFNNSTFNPFNFDDIERVQEAIYGWAAVNFAKGTLVKDTEGTGTVLNRHRTWGMLEMGGASTQIAWFQNDQDVMANLIKLQLGAARHWNVYAHSFLYFGVEGAWSRLNAKLYNNGQGTTKNPCLPSNSSLSFESWMHYDEMGRPLPRSDERSSYYKTDMFNDEASVDECARHVRALLRKEANTEWVEFSHDGDCSFAGVYQPPLPQQDSLDNEFIVTSNYYDVWTFLQLPPRANIQQLQERAMLICQMDVDELITYIANLEEEVKEDAMLQYCFRAMFSFEMLHTGYGFPLEYHIEAADVVNGQKLGWALGSTLYEINTLPWEFDTDIELKVKSKLSHHHLKRKGPHKAISNHAIETNLYGIPSSTLFEKLSKLHEVVLFGSIYSIFILFVVVRGRRRSNDYQEISTD